MQGQVDQRTHWNEQVLPHSRVLRDPKGYAWPGWASVTGCAAVNVLLEKIAKIFNDVVLAITWPINTMWYAEHVCACLNTSAELLRKSRVVGRRRREGWFLTFSITLPKSIFFVAAWLRAFDVMCCPKIVRCSYLMMMHAGFTERLVKPVVHRGQVSVWGANKLPRNPHAKFNWSTFKTKEKLKKELQDKYDNLLIPTTNNYDKDVHRAIVITHETMYTHR